jgi:hypothetical protein
MPTTAGIFHFIQLLDLKFFLHLGHSAFSMLETAGMVDLTLKFSDMQLTCTNFICALPSCIDWCYSIIHYYIIFQIYKWLKTPTTLHITLASETSLVSSGAYYLTCIHFTENDPGYLNVISKWSNKLSGSNLSPYN